MRALIHHRQHLRGWAARVLMVCVLGILSSAANACTLGSWTASNAPAAVVKHMMADDHDADQGPLAKAHCQTLCDKVSATASSPKVSPDLGDNVAMPIAVPVLAVPRQEPLPLRLAAYPRASSSAPIPIAFLRLTL